MLKLAIDFGTSATKIYRLGNGVVLSEATCVTVGRDTGRVHAFGNDAKKLLGKTADTEVVFPVYEGEIVDERLAGALLEYFLGKLERSFSVEALFCVPCGYSEEQRAKYLRAARMAGISRVSFAETPYLAALGQNVPISESNPVFSIDIGAGKTSLAAFSLDGIIAGLSMNVGGNNMDVHIIDHIAQLYNLKIGSLTAEKLKNTVGSLYAGDHQSTVVQGRDVTTGKPRSVAVYSEDIYAPISGYMDTILEYAELILRKLPEEVSAAMCRSGVYLSGGVCSMPGLGDYVAERLQMESHVAAKPHMAVVLGGGRALGNPALLRKIRMD